MPNSKGNVFPFLTITNNFQIFGIDAEQNAHQLSDTLFAMDIGISEDGTIWVLSSEPDPDGGGAKIFWGNGDGNWTEIVTTDPGGIRVSGGPGSSCYFITYDGEIRTMDTDGSSTIFDNHPDRFYVEFDYGGGYVWAILSTKPGEVPHLFYSEAANLVWTAFPGDPQPFSISANYDGNCAGISRDLSPVTYPKDGSSSFSSGGGVNNQAIQTSFKSWSYLITTDTDQKGNLVSVWEDIAGGTFKPTAIRANKVLATYYSKA